MRKEILHAALIVLVLGCFKMQAQDPIFSQFYAAPIVVNPAFTGNSYAPRISLNYRNQWPGIGDGGAYTTYAASYDQFAEALNSGFGLLLLTDDAGAGILRTTKLSGLYSYRVQFNDRLFAKIGLEAGYVQSRLDWDQLIFGDQIDELGGFSPGGSAIPTQEERPEDLNRNYFDLSAGMLVYSDRFYGGVSLKHLNRPEDSFLGVNPNLQTGVPIRTTVHAGAEFDLGTGNIGNEPAFISPNILYANQGPFSQIIAGAYIGFGTLFGGAWYRHAFGNPDAVIGLVGVRINEIKVGYSFDATTSGLGLNNTGGSHELSLSFDLQKPRKPDFNDCLQMFR